MFKYPFYFFNWMSIWNECVLQKFQFTHQIFSLVTESINQALHDTYKYFWGWLDLQWSIWRCVYLSCKQTLVVPFNSLRSLPKQNRSLYTHQKLQCILPDDIQQFSLQCWHYFYKSAKCFSYTAAYTFWGLKQTYFWLLNFLRS